MTTILIASVGGSRAPLIGAVTSRRPDLALFVVTRREDSQPGSADEVPAILEAAQASSLPHRLVVVPADDPEEAFLTLREALREVRAEHPAARLVFDYTGGTKSMTTALFQCALATPGAEVQFMAGRRENLEKVTPGTERASRIPIDWLLAERAEARLRGYWQDFAYAECAAGARALLADLEHDEKAPKAAIRRLQDLAEAAWAFDLWDRFRHAEAAARLSRLAERHPALVSWRDLARRCSDCEPQRIADLRRNAERCAARGRFDDAIARGYRLIEWIGQWRLRTHGIDVDALDWSKISEEEIARAGIEDRRKAGAKTLSGLVQTLKLAAVKEPGGVIDAFLREPYPGAHSGKKAKSGESRLRDMIELRNTSILAHGSRPLGQQEWLRFADFLDHLGGRVLAPLLRDVGAIAEPPQFPTAPPDTI